MKKDFKTIVRCVPIQVKQAVLFICCVTACTFLQLTASAQANANLTITGKVSSSQGEALAGVTVHVKNTSASTATDGTGNFSISAAADAVLEITYIGYVKQEVPVAGKTSIMIVL